MDYTRMTADELLELLYWLHDRSEYRRKCNKPEVGEDTAARYAAEDELSRRGIAFPLFFQAVPA